MRLVNKKINNMEISEINTDLKEGKLLLMAIAALTVSPEVHVNGKILDGRKTTPFEMLDEINEVVKKVYNSEPAAQESDTSKAK